MRIRLALLLTTLNASVALAEGVEPKRPKTDTTDRVNSVTTMLPAPDGALISVGHNTLKRLAPGARTFETLHAIKGDGLYRVAMNARGDVLAAWEKDPSIHYFTRDRKHLLLPKPASPRERIHGFHVDSLEFLPNGRDALVHMAGREDTLSTNYDVTFRIALDGSTPAEPVAQIIAARKIDFTAERAIYLLPKVPGQRCEHLSCDPVEAVVADFFDADGNAQRKRLLDGDAMEIGFANIVWGDMGKFLLLRAALPKNKDVFIRFRPGVEQPDLWPLEGFSPFDDETLHALPNGEVLQVKVDGAELTLTRHLLDGGQEVAKVPARPRSRGDWDHTLHGFGARRDGRVWLHWGNHLLLFGKDLTAPPRSHDLAPLLARFTQWADAERYDPARDMLWIGLDRSRSRDFVRIDLAAVEKRAKPWTAAPMATSKP